MATLYWYRVSNQFDITVHDTPDLTLKLETKYWIEVVFNKRIHTTSISKNDFELCEYNVFTNTIEPCLIKEQNLTCINIYDRISNTWGTKVCFEIEDAEQYRRKLEFGGVQIENGKEADEAIIDGINFMKKFDSYKTWDRIDLKRENIRYKKTIESLYNKIKLLESQINSNKDSITQNIN